MAYNIDLKELSQKLMEPFDKRPNYNTQLKNIDPIILRDYLEEAGLLQPEIPLENYYSDTVQIAEFIPSICLKKSLDNDLCLRNFTLLMFGKKNAISLNFPDIYTVFSIYKGTDRSEPTGEKYTLTGPIIEQAKKALAMIDILAGMSFDKDSSKPNKEKFPRKALQEAIINAIVHRDYEISEPIRITAFTDRVEIRSPGTLHWSVDKEKFINGKAGPKWRNQSFAYLFNKLRLTQSEGQGIPTIIRTMKEEGCPAPVFEIGKEDVTCILHANSGSLWK